MFISDTCLLLRSTGWRHWGELLRVLLTNEDTGWKVKMSLDWSSFRASRDFTSPKSSHLLTSSCPSRMAGILKHNQVIHHFIHHFTKSIFPPSASLPVMNALQIWGGIHSDYTVCVEGFSTTWWCPAVKQSSHSQQPPSSPFTCFFHSLANA